MAIKSILKKRKDKQNSQREKKKQWQIVVFETSIPIKTTPKAKYFQESTKIHEIKSMRKKTKIRKVLKRKK